MFFVDDRLDFFKPLTSKYREQFVACLSLLYQRQYSVNADYGHSLNRELTLEILAEALARSVNLVLDDEADNAEQRFKNPKDQASWVLKSLIESGWIERQVDSATLESSFPFSRIGRIFSQTLIEADNSTVRTRHRNTRNTLNALEAFSNRAEAYDLLDAYDYSERIVTDFADVIAELEEKKRELVKEVESQQLVEQASEQFFEFMEKRFQPDIQVRLSADSVEKHRDDINKIIQKIRKKPKEFKAKAEGDLRRIMPDLCRPTQSYLLFVLDSIEQRMRNASEIMLPALRSALHGFTKRADIIIRQLSFLHGQQNNNLVEVCRELSDLSPETYSARLNLAAEKMGQMQIKLIDPSQIKLQERRQKHLVDSSVQESPDLDQGAQRELMIQQLLDQAFVSNKKSLKEYIFKSLREGKKLSTRELNIEDAPSLMAMASAIEVGAVNNMSSDLVFKVEPLWQFVEDTEYYSRYDEFTIELVKDDRTEKTLQND